MSALGRTARHQPLHVFGQAFDVERRVLHVVADVVGIGLGVFLALLETSGGPGMRAGVVDRLPLFQELDRAVDVLGLGQLSGGNEGYAGNQTETGQHRGQPDFRASHRHRWSSPFEQQTSLVEILDGRKGRGLEV